MEPINLDEYLGRLVKVVYRESPESPEIIQKGILIGADVLFIQLKTASNTFLINRNQIVSIKIFGNGEGEQ